MKDFQMSSFEIKKSKTDMFVPVVNGVHLHSIYNPEREANNFIEKNLDLLKVKNEVLLLGLGFGYHLHELCKTLKNFHGEDYKVYVIEPNLNVYEGFKKHNPIKDNNVAVICDVEIPVMYSNFEFVKYLIDKPGILMHPASYNLYEDFFKKLLSYKAPTHTTDSLYNIENGRLRNYLLSKNENNSIMDLIESDIVPLRSFDNAEDHLLLAFKEMTRKSIELDSSEA